MAKGTKKILVADDDPGILDALKIMLEEIGGYNVDVVADGQELLEMNDNLPDLILLDLWMSGVNGGEVCQELKSRSHTKHIPIIIFSANKDIKSIANSVGANDFLAKPFQMKDLLAKVKSYVGE